MYAISVSSSLCASAAGAVLLFAAIGKGRRASEFEQILRRTAPAMMRNRVVTWTTARALVLLEAALGLLLLASAGSALRASAIAATALTAGFVPVVVHARRRHRPCGCMGNRGARPVTRSRIAFNLLLVAATGAAIAAPPRGVVERMAAGTVAVIVIATYFCVAAVRARPRGGAGTALAVSWGGAVQSRRSFLRRLVGFAGAAVGMGLVSNVARPLRAYACDFWNYSVATPNPAEVGQSVTFTAPYTSTSPGSTLPITVQWGDGAIDTYVITAQSRGTFTETHVYGAAGDFRITADFQDVIGAVTTTEITIYPSGQPDECELAHATCDSCSDNFTQQCLANAAEDYRICVANASTPQDYVDCQNAYKNAQSECIGAGAATSNCCVDCLEACDERADQCFQGACSSCWPIAPI